VRFFNEAVEDCGLQKSGLLWHCCCWWHKCCEGDFEEFAARFLMKQFWSFFIYCKKFVVKLLKDCAMKLLEKLLEWLASLEHATRLHSIPAKC
jgi:hypothetical protein